MVLREPEAEVTFSSLYQLSLQDRAEYQAPHSTCFGLKQAQENRSFRNGAVTWLARQGIRQFVDIGSGLPTARNTRQAVRDVDHDRSLVPCLDGSRQGRR
jgi:hypothetical protein